MKKFEEFINLIEKIMKIKVYSYIMKTLREKKG
jgi:hypothetical protein